MLVEFQARRVGKPEISSLFPPRTRQKLQIGFSEASARPEQSRGHVVRGSPPQGLDTHRELFVP